MKILKMISSNKLILIIFQLFQLIMIVPKFQILNMNSKMFNQIKYNQKREDFSKQIIYVNTREFFIIILEISLVRKKLYLTKAWII